MNFTEYLLKIVHLIQSKRKALRRFFVIGFRSSKRLASHSTWLNLPWSKHLHIVSPDLGLVSAFALLVVITGITNATFYVKLVTLMDIFLYYLGQTLPQNDIMPISTVRNLGTVRQCIATLGSCQRQSCHSNSLVNIADFGILAHVSN